jgi:hypothetical protein
VAQGRQTLVDGPDALAGLSPERLRALGVNLAQASDPGAWSGQGHRTRFRVNFALWMLTGKLWTEVSDGLKVVLTVRFDGLSARGREPLGAPTVQWVHGTWRFKAERRRTREAWSGAPERPGPELGPTAFCGDKS